MNAHHGDTELNRIRVDHVGGLPRPVWLREIQARFEDGTVSAEELEAEQRRAVGAVIGKQEELRLPIVTDGEFTRHNFQESFGGAVTGFDATPASDAAGGFDSLRYMPKGKMAVLGFTLREAYRI